MLWRHDTAQDGTSAQFHGDALVTDALVVVGTDARPAGHLYAFARDSGEVRWQHSFPYGVGVDIRRHGDAVLATSMLGDVVAVALGSGEIVWWEQTEAEPDPQELPVDPALFEARYYVPWRTGHLEAYDAASGALIWRSELPASPNTSVVALGDELAVGTIDGRLLRLDRRSGELSRELRLGAMLYGELVVAGDCLLTLIRPDAGEQPAGHQLACIRPDLGGVRWRHSSRAEGMFGSFEPLVRGDQVVAGVEGELFGVALADGTPRWSLPMKGLPRGLGSSRSTLYVGHLGGTVLALPWAVEAPESQRTDEP